MDNKKESSELDYIDLNIRAASKSQPDVNTEKEIDLLFVMEKIYRLIKRNLIKLGGLLKQFFLWLKHVFLLFIKFILKYFWTFLILIASGIVTGIAKTRTEKPFYESSMLVETKLVPRSQIADRINMLQHYMDDQNVAFLARELGIREDDAENVFYIKADIVNVEVEQNRKVVKEVDGKEVIVEETVKEQGPQFMRIKMKFWDNSAILKMEPAIVKFVDQDSYVQERLAVFRKNNMARQRDLEAQIQRLYLFQEKNIEKSSNALIPGDTPLMVQTEEKTYVGEILNLQNQILALQEQYELTKPISVIQPFVFYENPVNRMFINVFMMVLMFAGAGFVVLLIINRFK